MIITIHEGYDNNYVILTSKDEHFQNMYGSKQNINTKLIYSELENISSWCNNVVGEECLFEID